MTKDEQTTGSRKLSQIQIDNAQTGHFDRDMRRTFAILQCLQRHRSPHACPVKLQKIAFHTSPPRRRRTMMIPSRQQTETIEECNTPDYSSWTHTDLVARVTELEKQLKEKAAS